MEIRCHADRLTGLFRKAIAAGAQIVTASHLVWSRHGDCTAPVGVSLYSRPESFDRPWVSKTYVPSDVGGYKRVDKARTVVVDRPDEVMWLDMQVRCRKCAACLLWRGRQWTARAIHETQSSQRTWFGTLTLSPQALARLTERANARYGDKAASYTDALARLNREVSEELTKYIKRVRKVSGARLRYLIAQEEHKSGLPHWHVLVHEVVGSDPVLYRHLADKWELGFVKWNLIRSGENDKAAVYACKYLNKAQSARVRASVRYGKNRLSDSQNDVPFPEGEAPQGKSDLPQKPFLEGTELNGVQRDGDIGKPGFVTGD